MADLKTRITKLEKSHRVPDVPVTEEQARRIALELCEFHMDEHEQELAWAALHFPECRRFFKDDGLWLRDPTHRLGVFLGFRGVVCKLPNWDTDKRLKRLFDVFGFGWGGNSISQDDIDFVLANVTAMVKKLS